MQEQDRKLAAAGALTLIVIAAELAWLIFVGPAHGHPTCGTENTPQCDGPFWTSPEFWTAAFTFALTVSTILLWWQTRRLAEGAETQANDFRAQLTIARDDFVSTHRPWVAFEAKIGAKGVWFDPQGLHVSMDFFCHNTGSTPAIGVSINAQSYLWSPVADELAKHDEVCAALSSSDFKKSSGVTIFPGGKWTFQIEYLIPRAAIDAVTAVPKVIIVNIGGCVDYMFSFGEDVAHQSRFIYYVGRPAPLASQVSPFIDALGPVAPAEVRLVRCRLTSAFRTT